MGYPTNANVLSAFVHKIASPVGAMQNYADLVSGPERVRDGLRSSLVRVRDLLDAARGWIEAATFEPRFDRVATGEAALAATEALPRAARDALELHMEEPLPAVRADPDGLRMALELLLEGIVRCNGNARVRVTLRARTQANGVLLVFADDGPVWTDEACRKALEPFGDAARGASTALARAAMLIERQGGRMETRADAAEGRVHVLLEAA